MSISGHRTESAYKRYLIGSERRAVAAGLTMETYWQGKESEQTSIQAGKRQ
jgi:hypothetical protein